MKNKTVRVRRHRNAASVFVSFEDGGPWVRPTLKRELNMRMGKVPNFANDGVWWPIPKSRFADLMEWLKERYAYIKLEADHTTTQQCNVSCQNAQKEDCECSCLGVHHGEGYKGRPWKEVTNEVLIQHDMKRVTLLYDNRRTTT